ncbi:MULTISPECIES: TetR/AcrR family transcriptional regulator [unclassified Mucilaginibacter]|uniref:TetR/AcrR family transcriptional regulator n=2 Tax=Mucilaginibacter TaxID=423349 RepID=UPI002AC9A025|nr:MULTISPECIES: TetR/AcrR family transcriptional regulator [unclassified Mucilaginibacter]MEB0262685.1 TetR/AcrR family transcriptional regulator [Mucilaginibacter sp. 10I4]MEB0279477.1 TetR/AcrR family transcriptional regulator [Mucilaginibacter sp. 10B2]MEB0300038.1 TetR/AcrR family transcriptional regulator [Mucilaginibacter sp. 5C4]WPX21851.1 TetR/AcrR family transcriptional regulator [Mucilaginibacter sp. 5C4]
MARTKDFDEDAVLKKAVDLFWLKGYNATSMQDLVDGLGISRSSLYDTYGDKHSLFIKALESYQCTNTGKFVTIIEGGKSAKETIKALLKFISDNLLDDKSQKGCFIVNAEVEVALHDKEVGDMIQKNDQNVEDAFFRVIQKGQESGEISNKQDARALARFIFNTVKGIQVTAKSTTERAVFDDIISLAVGVLG